MQKRRQYDGGQKYCMTSVVISALRASYRCSVPYYSQDGTKVPSLNRSTLTIEFLSKQGAHITTVKIKVRKNSNFVEECKKTKKQTAILTLDISKYKHNVIYYNVAIFPYVFLCLQLCV